MNNSHWFRNNLTALLALAWTLSTIALNFCVLFKVVKTEKEIITLITNNNYDNMAIVMGYYFVASKQGYSQTPMVEEKTTVSKSFSVNESSPDK